MSQTTIVTKGGTSVEKPVIKAYFDAWRGVYADGSLSKVDLALLVVLKDTNFEKPVFAYDTLAERIGLKGKYRKNTIWRSIRKLVGEGRLQKTLIKRHKASPLSQLEFVGLLRKPEGLPVIVGNVEDHLTDHLPASRRGVYLPVDGPSTDDADRMSDINNENIYVLGASKEKIKKQIKKQENTNTYIHTPISMGPTDSEVPVEPTGTTIEPTGTTEAGLTPLTEQELWVEAGKLNVTLDDLREIQNNIIEDIEGENKYRIKNIPRTLHKWVQNQLVKGFIKKWGEYERLCYPLENPIEVAKNRAQTKLMVEMGLL